MENEEEILNNLREILNKKNSNSENKESEEEPEEKTIFNEQETEEELENLISDIPSSVLRRATPTISPFLEQSFEPTLENTISQTPEPEQDSKSFQLQNQQNQITYNEPKYSSNNFYPESRTKKREFYPETNTNLTMNPGFKQDFDNPQTINLKRFSDSQNYPRNQNSSEDYYVPELKQRQDDNSLPFEDKKKRKFVF
jgi:hypothetical protein